MKKFGSVGIKKIKHFVESLLASSSCLLAKTILTLFSTIVKMSAYANPFIELSTTVLDATIQIKSCMITTKKNTSVYSLIF